MSDEKRREELKAKINEQLDKLSIEELESVAGGFEIQGGVYCPVCGEHFKSYGELNKHMEYSHSGKKY